MFGLYILGALLAAGSLYVVEVVPPKPAQTTRVAAHVINGIYLFLMVWGALHS